MARFLRRIGKVKLLLGTATLIAIIVAIAVFLLLDARTSKTPDTTVAQTIVYSTDSPDETKQGSSYIWKGSAKDPRKIIIPSLGIDNYIQNVGVDQNKEMTVPNNIHLAGWFVDSVRPGDKGLSIIDGHLNGRQADGIFIDLERIKTDEKFMIEFGDGSRRTFVVKNVQVVDLDKAAGVLFSQDPGIRNQLNLVTCGGNFDRHERLYDKRVIVTSGMIKSA